MTLSQRDIKQRRDRILGITIDQYIHTVNPVSSKFIAREFPQTLSPATIRNILAELEHEGYLTHPHTSAGRIPTEKGYRYYVDNLMKEIQLLQEEKEHIRSEYERESLELESLLDKTSRVIADTTHYTSIVCIDEWSDKYIYTGTGYVVDYPDYQQDIKKIKEILKALDEKKNLLHIINQNLENKVSVFIGHEIEYSNISSCSLVISRFSVKNGPSGKLAVLGPTRMDYERVVSALDYFSSLIEEIL